MAVYAIVAYDLAGCKDVLGLWMQESEGARHWMGVFDELRGRGVEDVLFVSMDGVAGLEDGLCLLRRFCYTVPRSTATAFHGRLPRSNAGCSDCEGRASAPL
ncbi:transposase, partial [Eggerthella lenta]|nr:transposase [Eggerthella lenta]